MERPLSRLDIGTIYDHRKQWGIKIFKFPKGGFEAVIRPRYTGTAAVSNGQGSPLSEKQTNEANGGQKGTESSAPRRAKTQIRRFVMGAGCDRLLTLTYRANLTDRKASKHHVQLLMRRLRRWANDKDFHWLAVPEYQKRGAIHWHIALNRRFDAKQVRAAWLEIIGQAGNIDLQYIPRPEVQSRYLAKYIGKDLDDDTKDRHLDKRYLCSRGLKIPEVYLMTSTWANAVAEFDKITGGKWDGSVYEFEGTYWVSAF